MTMGCTPSKSLDELNHLDSKQKSNPVVKPRASITVGKGIGKNIAADESRIVFIFGGPGCGKGSVVHNLINAFDFKFIAAEQVILQNLAKKFNVPDATPSTLKEIIDENSLDVTLEWVLKMVADEMKMYPHQPILIDAMPNLKSLVKGSSFAKDCEAEMKHFEEKFPISLAINLSVRKEHLINKTHKTHAAVKTTQKTEEKKAGPSDEVDTSRTHRRFKRYEESVHDFIDYFKKTDRILTVNTGSGRNDVIWESIMAYFVDSDIVRWQRPLDLVLLFCFSTDDVGRIDQARYQMKEIDIEDLVQNSQDRNLVTVLVELSKYIDSQTSEIKNFMINIDGVDVNSGGFAKAFADLNQWVELRQGSKGKPIKAEEATIKTQDSKKSLMFEEINVGQLDYFIHNVKRRSKRRKSSTRKGQQVYKAICSTENETLLFPQDVDSDICHRIANFLSKRRFDNLDNGNMEIEVFS